MTGKRSSSGVITNVSEIPAQRASVEEPNAEKEVQKLHAIVTNLRADRDCFASLLENCVENYDSATELIQLMQREISQLQVQKNYLQRENNEYRRKLSKITDTWYGRCALQCYRFLRRVKRKLASPGGK